MEASYYNYIAPYGNKYLCLNGVSGRILALEKNAFDLFSELLVDQDKRSEYPTLVNKMLDGRFLVNNKEEDINLLRERNREVISNHDSYILTINPTMDCNFKCWYCYEKHKEGGMSKITMRRIQKFVHNLFMRPDIRNFSLGWFGGEPLLHFDDVVYPLSRYIQYIAKEKGIIFSNSMTTNGFLFTDEMIKRCVEINLESFEITIDGNRNIHDRVRNQNGEPSFDRIMSNCIKLMSQSKDIRITLRVNYTSHSLIGNNYAEIIAMVPMDLRSRVMVQFQRVWQTYEKEGSDTEVMQSLSMNKASLEDAGFTVSHNTQFSIYKGNVCYGDKPNYTNINFDGKIFRCTAQDYNPQDSFGFINEDGNIVWTNDKFKSIDGKANFENELCLNCKILPLCGGPCFNKRLYMERNNILFCPMKKSDIKIDTFIIESYKALLNKKGMNSMSEKEFN
jgi:uncharacterized protein